MFNAHLIEMPGWNLSKLKVKVKAAKNGKEMIGEGQKEEQDVSLKDRTSRIFFYLCCIAFLWTRNDKGHLAFNLKDALG